jgi:hypothetical protein
MAYLENNKIIRNFITKDEASQIVNWIDGVEHGGDNRNHHLKQLSKELNGKSYIFDISNTPLTNYITNFQSIYNVSNEGVPTFIHSIIDKIAKEFGFSKDNIFPQYSSLFTKIISLPHPFSTISVCNFFVILLDSSFFGTPRT